MAVDNPDTLSPYQVGTSVSLRAPIASTTQRYAEGYARIQGFMPDLAEGAVYLDRPLKGTHYWHLTDLELTGEAKAAALLEVVKAMRDWIDAVPSEVQLPTMPGIDRDWADEVIRVCSHTQT